MQGEFESLLVSQITLILFYSIEPHDVKGKYISKFFGGKFVCNTTVFFRHLILLACQKVVRLYYAADNLISRQGATSFCKVKSGGTANICNLDILTTLTLRQCELEFQYLRPLSTLYTVAMRFP